MFRGRAGGGCRPLNIGSCDIDRDQGSHLVHTSVLYLKAVVFARRGGYVIRGGRRAYHAAHSVVVATDESIARFGAVVTRLRGPPAVDIAQATVEGRLVERVAAGGKRGREHRGGDRDESHSQHCVVHTRHGGGRGKETPLGQMPKNANLFVTVDKIHLSVILITTAGEKKRAAIA